MPLLKELENRARRTPDLPFLIDGDRTLSFKETWEACGLAAGELVRLGVQPGDRVILASPNSIHFCISLYGIYRAGAIAVLVNPRWTAHEIEGAIKLTRPRLVLGEQSSAELAKLSLPLTPIDLAGHTKERAIARRSNPDGIALMLLTSGTTGKPKAVMLTQEAIAANAAQMTKRKQITEKDRFLCSIPLFHSNGQVAALSSMLMGGASIALLDRFTPETLLASAKKYRTTAISGVPTLYQHLINHYRKAPFDLSFIRICVSGSAPMPTSLIEEVEKTFNAFILEGYGLTECSAGATGNPIERRKPGTVGTALEGTEIKIVDSSGRRMKPGESGEIYIRGPQMMRGYYQDVEATRAALTEDGWLRSGDLGTVDSDGYVTILSRKKELIIRSGFNVYPAEVESVLREIEGVLDVTVVGLPDQLHGESVHAALISDLDEAELASRIKSHAADKLARYKRPTSFSTHHDFPRTGSAKVQKATLASELKGQPEQVMDIAWDSPNAQGVRPLPLN